MQTRSREDREDRREEENAVLPQIKIRCTQIKSPLFSYLRSSDFHLWLNFFFASVFAIFAPSRLSSKKAQCS